MRTTLDIDRELLEKVVEATGERSKTKAVNKALQEYVRRKSIHEIQEMAGKFIIDDTRKEQRKAGRLREAFLDGLSQGHVTC